MEYKENFEVLPENWNIAKIKEITDTLQNGLSSNKKDDNGILQLRGNNITRNGDITLEDSVKIVIPNNIDRYDVQKDDILFNNTNSAENIGKTAIFNGEYQKYTFNNHITRIRVNRSKITPEWLYYILNWKKETGYFSQIGAGSTGLKRIKINDFKNIRIPVPHIMEQQRITKILSLIDKNTQQSIEIQEKTGKFRNSLLKQLLTKGIKNKEFKDSKIGKIPMLWNIKELGEITEINKESRNPKSEKDKEFYYIDIKSVESNTGVIKDARIIKGAEAPSRARRVVHYKDVIMSTVRPNLKAFAVIPKEYDGQISSTGFAVLTCKDNILPQFLLYALFSNPSVDQYNKMVMGGSYPALNSSQVAKIKIPVPEISEQEKIVDILLKTDNKFKLKDQRTKKLKKLKRGLMNDLLIGKKRVDVN